MLRGEPAAEDDRGRICMKAARMILEKSGAFSAAKEPALIDELVNEGLACASDRDIRAWLRALWGATAIWWVNAGAELSSLDERVESLYASLLAARGASLPELEAFAQEYLCEIHMARGAYGEVAELSRSTGVFDRMASPAGCSLGLVETAIWARDVAGEPERALALGMRAFDIARELSPHDLMHATGFVIPALYQLGRWLELDPVLEEHVAAFADEADATCELLHGGILAGATRFAQGGDLERARELAAMAPPFASTDPLWAGYADGWRARLRVAAGDARGGVEQARAVLASAPAWPRLHAAVIVIEALSAPAITTGLPPSSRSAAGWTAVWPCFLRPATGRRGTSRPPEATPPPPAASGRGRSRASSGSASRTRRPGRGSVSPPRLRTMSQRRSWRTRSQHTTKCRRPPRPSACARRWRSAATNARTLPRDQLSPAGWPVRSPRAAPRRRLGSSSSPRRRR